MLGLIRETMLGERLAQLAERRPKHTYAWGVRQVISSPAAGTTSELKLTVPATGAIIAVTVFPSDADDGDWVSCYHGSRALLERQRVYRQTSVEWEGREEVRAGDGLTVIYFNQGTTSKKVDWSFQVEYS